MSKRKAKDFTIVELKRWLEGLMEFQEKNWVPTKQQWDTVVKKIMATQEVPDTVVVEDDALVGIKEQVEDGLRTFFRSAQHAGPPVHQLQSPGVSFTEPPSDGNYVAEATDTGGPPAGDYVSQAEMDEIQRQYKEARARDNKAAGQVAIEDADPNVSSFI